MNSTLGTPHRLLGIAGMERAYITASENCIQGIDSVIATYSLLTGN